MIKPVTYLHLPVGNGRVSMTIVYHETSKSATVGLSFCSPKDQFNRKKGREISQSRALKLSAYSFDVAINPSFNLREQVVVKFKQLCREGRFETDSSRVVPKWIAKEVKREVNYNV